MFKTIDNTGYIRINYTSNAEVADKVNRLAAELDNVPLVSSPFTMGGYSYPILEVLANGRDFQILKSFIPKDADHIRLLKFVLDSAETAYAYVDAAQITIVQIKGWNHPTENLNTYGFSVISAKKTFKRFKTLNRPFRIWDRPGRKLRVAVVDDSDYSDSDLSEFDIETAERLLDGAIVVSRDLYRDCLKNLDFPARKNDHYDVDYLRQRVFLAQAQGLKAFNARIFGEFQWIGISDDDPMWDKTGMIKAQAFLNASDLCERMGVDIIMARSALKGEVSCTETIILLEPQSAKFHANADVQSITNNPALFDPDFMQQWIKKMLLGAFEDLKNDKLLEQWYRMDSPQFSGGEKKYDNNDLIELTKWNCRAWVMSGMSLKDSPWLFEQMAKNLVSMIHTNDVTKIRIPVPCAVRCQVVSQSLASMAGTDVEVIDGSIRWLPEHQVLVVSDADWLEMYESHGGMDLDDFFVGYWRTIGNVRKVVIMRSPNDYGEYSIFDYVEGDWYPQEEMYDGMFMLFPEISSAEELWPKRLSEAVRDGDVIYKGLPSELHDEPTGEPRPYSMLDVAEAIVNNVGSQSCVGANVNARSLWSICARRHRPIQLAPMEACIDTGAQGGHADDIAAVTAEAQDILAQIVKDPSIKIDEYLWKTRFFNLYQIPFDVNRIDRSTHLSRIHAFRVAFVKSFIEMTRKYVSNHVGQNADPRIHQLGKRFLRPGYELLKQARYSLVITQSDGQTANVTTWSDIHDYVLRELRKKEKLTDQYDFVLGLYSACLKVPTRSTGRLSDQVVMNPDVFPLLMDALRHYHIAHDLEVTDDGQIIRIPFRNWVLECQDCSLSVETDSPLALQSYQTHNGLCATCSKK